MTERRHTFAEAHPIGLAPANLFAHGRFRAPKSGKLPEMVDPYFYIIESAITRLPVKMSKECYM